MNDAIFAMLVFSIPLTFIFTRFYLRLQELKLKNGVGTGNSLHKEMGNLMADNENLKERMKNLEYILTDEKRRINLQYEKEQILIDQQNKIK